MLKLLDKRLRWLYILLKKLKSMHSSLASLNLMGLIEPVKHRKTTITNLFLPKFSYILNAPILSVMTKMKFWFPCMLKLHTKYINECYNVCFPFF